MPTYRKDIIFSYLKEYTQNTFLQHGDISNPGIDARSIAQALSLDRANVSRDLNELYREGMVIKLLGKPTRYLDHQLIIRYYPNTYIPNTIPSNQTLKEYIFEAAEHKKLDYSNSHNKTLINREFPSLNTAAIQAESAINYAPFGLHTLIAAPPGSGKTVFAEKMFNYGKMIEKFAFDAKLISFDGRSYDNSPKTVIAQLFGCAAGALSPSSASRKGLIERAEGSVLLLNEIQFLPYIVQEKLIDFITNGHFTRLGEGGIKRQLKLMIIATTSSPLSSAELPPLLNYFPMQIELPSLSQHTAKELLLYVYQFFQDEATLLDCEFNIDKGVFYYLLCASFYGDFISLRGNVKSICAIACRDNISSGNSITIEIGYRHLPSTVLDCNALPPSTADFLDLLDTIVETNIMIHKNSTPPPTLLQAPVTIPLCEKYSVLNNVSEHPGYNYVESYINEYLTTSSNLSNTPIDDSPVTTAHILHILSKDSILGKLTKNDPLILGLSSLLVATLNAHINYHALNIPDTFSLETVVPTDLRVLSEKLETDFCRLQQQASNPYRISLIALYLFCAKERIQTNHIHIIFLFHGEGVSEGMAKYINTLYHCSVIPIPYDDNFTAKSLLLKMDFAVSTLPAGSHILLFTDGTPFDTVQDYLKDSYHFFVKHISNTTLSTIQKTIRKIACFYFTLDMLYTDTAIQEEHPHTLSDSLVDQAIQTILAPSLSFIDINKAIVLLSHSLDEILLHLSIQYNENMAIKYYFHCTHMIERLIQKESLSHTNLKSIISRYANETKIIGNALRPIAQTYGIKIPSSEIAYLIDIFITEDSPSL